MRNLTLYLEIRIDSIYCNLFCLSALLLWDIQYILVGYKSWFQLLSSKDLFNFL